LISLYTSAAFAGEISEFNLQNQFTVAACNAHHGDVRRYAKEQGIAEEAAIQKGLEQRATEFNEAGAEIYAKTQLTAR